MVNKKINILLIEDDTIEVMKFKRTLNTLQLDHSLTIADNGESAMDILLTGDLLPELIILDLNMPKMNGIEFLQALKGNNKLYHIPAVILTTSTNQNDIIACYRAGIAGYMIKPLKYEDYVANIEKLLAYWSVNELKSIEI